MQVVFLEGRTMHRKQERPRWADAYNGDSSCVANLLATLIICSLICNR